MQLTNTPDAPDIRRPGADEPHEHAPRTPTPTSAATGLTTPRLGWWTKIHWGLLLVALVILVVAGQGQHFFRDDWAFIGGKLDALPFPGRYLLPHNEHWSLLPILAFRTLRATVGVGSYWPYLGLLLLLHLGVTHVLWRLMLVTGSKPVVATALAAIFSVLGAAAEDMVWAFQIGFVGSTLLGISAVYLAVTGTANWRKTAVLASLILASLATSGVGLAYLIVVPLLLAWRQWRYAITAFGLPLLVYVMWYAMYGRSLTHPPSASVTLPLTVGAFVALGLVTALTGYFGCETTILSFFTIIGVLILAALTLACRDWMANRTLARRIPVAMCVGAVVFFGTAALARGGLGLEIATSSRYVYVAMALLIPGLALLISTGADRHPKLIRAVVPIAMAIAVSNIFQLFTYATQNRQDSDTSRRVLVAATDLVRSNGPIFIGQLPEPLLAPDLSTTDLTSRYLDPAFAGVYPGRSDRLTASLNLQIRVTPVPHTSTLSACRTTLRQRITIPTSHGTAPRFVVSADASIAFTLHSAGLTSAPRVIDLSKGTYVINSLRAAADLAIEPISPASLSECQGPSGPALE
jgi:hypothetical protein